MASTVSEYRHSLPSGHHELDYCIERVLGEGGFGVTYLARDLRTDRQVAIKEYLPGEFARRDPALRVGPRSEEVRRTFEWGLERFLSEAELLARFDHPNIVRVERFFKANGTAYMVMSYVEGQSLFDVMAHQETLGERALLDILEPLLDGLTSVHRSKFLHRDIKPENIYVGFDGTPVLLDFGAARLAVEGLSRQLTSIVTPGYAPPEQYQSDGNQGPWTDIYALAGVLYMGITGRPPVEATARVNAVMSGAPDPLEPAVRAGRRRYSKAFLRAIDHGLAVRAEDRPQSIAEWAAELRAGRDDRSANNGRNWRDLLAMLPRPRPAPDARQMSRTTFLIASGAVAVGWASVPVLVRLFPLGIGAFELGPTIFTGFAGMITILAMKALVRDLPAVALPLATMGWAFGTLSQTALRALAPQIAGALAWPLTGVYFGASGVAGLIGGGAIALCARLARPPLNPWAVAVVALGWALPWWGQPYLFFNLRIALAGRIEAFGFALLDAALLGIAGLAGFLLTLVLWQPLRWPRWRRHPASRSA